VSCQDEWSPWPFVVLALVAAVAGVLVFLRTRRA
jgi:MYXO-CTERM domain-containing protein